MNPDQHSAGDAEEFCGDRLSAWKTELKIFFDTDREKLRRLIMQLEECGWQSEGSGGRAAGGMEQSPAGSEVRSLEHPTPGLPPETRPQPWAVSEGMGPQEEQKRQRLADLAETIEHKIRAADARLR